MSRPLAPSRRPIPWVAHRLPRSHPDRIAAEEERHAVGAARLIGPPVRPPRLRAGKPGLAGPTPGARKVAERAAAARKRSWGERLAAALLAATGRGA